MTRILKAFKPSIESKRGVVKRNNNGSYSVYSVEPVMSFSAMAELRRKSVSPEAINAGLNSAGHVFANIGVSVVLTTEHEGNDYLLTVRQDREDLGDSVAKLVSGYIPQELFDEPFTAMAIELSEEVLAFDRDNNLMIFDHPPQGYLNFLRFDCFADFSEERIEMIKGGRFVLPGVPKLDTGITDFYMSPEIYFHAPTNSAQLFFSYHLKPSKSFAELGVSLHHSEDKMVDGRLGTFFHPEGIYLIKLQENDLTDYVATLVNGKLNPVNPRKVLLSEAFASKENSIINVNNISLEDYLAKK